MLEEYEWILTPEEVSEILRVGPNKIYALLAQNEIRAFREGRIWKIPKTALIEYIMRRTGQLPSS